MELTERTPFYLIATIFLFVTIILSVISTFNIKNNGADFFPVGGLYNEQSIIDNTVVDKLCWYFSQLTHHTIFLLFTYFTMALLNVKSEKFFKMVAPLALTVSVLYFYFLYPKQQLKIHQLSFSNFFSHFMIIFLVFGELMYITDYTLGETTNCFIFILTSISFVLINYLLRGVWSYNLVKLDRFSGWKLVASTIVIMYAFSFMFYIIKYKSNSNNHFSIKKSGYFISGIVNIIFFLVLTA
jgi:hypothetical protein